MDKTLDLTERSTTLCDMKNTTDTYQRILESAQELIHASSYSDVGVAAICKKAKVQKGSFYHFFSSKQDLTLAVIDKNSADMKAYVIDQAFQPSLSPLERIQRFFDLIIETQIRIHQQSDRVYGCPFGNLATEMSTQDEGIRTRLGTSFTNLEGLMAQTLQEAVDDKEIEHVNSVDHTAQAMLAYFQGILLMAKTQNDPAILKQLVPAALKIRL